MIAHIIRIDPPVPRRVLLVLFFPLSFADSVLSALLDHPRTLLSARFYRVATAIFWAAWEGEFVPK